MKITIIKTNLTRFNHLNAKSNSYYIDEENKLIARLSTSNTKESEDFKNYYTNLGMNITSVYDLFDIKENTSFIIFDYIK